MGFLLTSQAKRLDFLPLLNVSEVITQEKCGVAFACAGMKLLCVPTI